MGNLLSQSLSAKKKLKESPASLIEKKTLTHTVLEIPIGSGNKVVYVVDTHVTPIKGDGGHIGLTLKMRPVINDEYYSSGEYEVKNAGLRVIMSKDAAITALTFISNSTEVTEDTHTIDCTVSHLGASVRTPLGFVSNDQDFFGDFRPCSMHLIRGKGREDTSEMHVVFNPKSTIPGFLYFSNIVFQTGGDVPVGKIAELMSADWKGIHIVHPSFPMFAHFSEDTAAGAAAGSGSGSGSGSESGSGAINVQFQLQRCWSAIQSKEEEKIFRAVCASSGIDADKCLLAPTKTRFEKLLSYSSTETQTTHFIEASDEYTRKAVVSFVKLTADKHEEAMAEIARLELEDKPQAKMVGKDGDMLIGGTKWNSEFAANLGTINSGMWIETRDPTNNAVFTLSADVSITRHTGFAWYSVEVKPLPMYRESSEDGTLHLIETSTREGFRCFIHSINVKRAVDEFKQLTEDNKPIFIRVSPGPDTHTTIKLQVKKIGHSCQLQFELNIPGSSSPMILMASPCVLSCLLKDTEFTLDGMPILPTVHFKPTYYPVYYSILIDNGNTFQYRYRRLFKIKGRMFAFRDIVTKDLEQELISFVYNKTKRNSYLHKGGQYEEQLVQIFNVCPCEHIESQTREDIHPDVKGFVFTSGFRINADTLLEWSENSVIKYTSAVEASFEEAGTPRGGLAFFPRLVVDRRLAGLVYAVIPDEDGEEDDV